MKDPYAHIGQCPFGYVPMLTPKSQHLRTGFGWENAFVVDCFLAVCHDVVDVLWSRNLGFFALLIQPSVLPAHVMKYQYISHEENVN